MKSMTVRFFYSVFVGLSLSFASVGISQMAIAEGLDNTKPTEVLPRKSWHFEDAGMLPVQSGGRIKPLDSFARESILMITGSTRYQGWNPTDLLLSWISYPDYWNEQLLIKVRHKDVMRQLLLPEGRDRFSPAELLRSPVVMQYGQSVMGRGTQAKRPDEPRMNPRDDELQQVIHRVLLFKMIVQGAAIKVFPNPQKGEWDGLDAIRNTPADLTAAQGQLRSGFSTLLTGYVNAHEPSFGIGSKTAREALPEAIPGWNSELKNKLYLEWLLHFTRPFFYAWVIYLFAGLMWAWNIVTRPEKSKAIVPLLLAVFGFLIHSYGFALRSYVSGRPPVSNMYESVIWVSFGVLVFAFIIYGMTRQKITMAVACFVAAICLIAGDSAPTLMDPSIHPLVPVLRSNYWLTIHVLTITLGYSAFALSLGISDLALFHFMRGGWFDPKTKQKIIDLNQLNYRAMQFGTVLLGAGTILGGVWADESWGRFWGWDPKEVWALIAFLAYIALLHARLFGFVGQLGYAAWSAVGFLTVLMAWYGVNFVLGVGLHSYGFSSGGFGGVLTLVCVHMAYVIFCVMNHKRIESGRQPSKS